ncbi:hypothetical protein [Ruegeria sp. HKCCD8929]|uniref:hypothetical protein n=1 Tax=Ruegeria sp. HKCCD8929 TaxID=2683006 RepID=UPI0014876DAE|nr:hypothetical protein [Ruegeria sp. HKCCD8929]
MSNPTVITADIIEAKQIKITGDLDSNNKPIVSSEGVINIFDGELKFWPTLDSDTDYDADMYAQGNMYLGASARVHLRPGLPGPGPEEGRVTVGAKSGVNYIQSGKDFSSTVTNDLAIGGPSSTNGMPSITPWLYFQAPSNGVGQVDVGINTRNPKGHFHIQTSEVSGSSANSGAKNFVIEEDGAHAGMTIITDNSHYGEVNFADPQDNNVGGIWYSHSQDSLHIRAGNGIQLTVHGDGTISMPNLPTSAPSGAGKIWNDNGVLKIV